MKKALLMNDTSITNHHGCVRVVENIEFFFKEIGVKIIYKHPVGTDWMNNKQFDDSLSKSDILIINAEGTIHHDRLRGRRLLEAIPKAKSLGMKVFLLNMTYQKNPIEYKFYLLQADLISVRESYSKTELQKIGIDALVIPDFTFYKQKKINSLGSKKAFIHVTDSVNKELTFHLFNLAKSNENAVFLPIYNSNPNKDLWSKYSIDGLKIPSKITIKKVLFNPIALYFEYITNNKLYTNIMMSYDDYLNHISLSNGIITARFHALCFAIQLKKKFVALKSNSFKVESMLEDIGVEKNRIQPIDNLKDQNIRIDEFSQLEIKNIEAYLKKSEEAFQVLNNLIWNLLNDKNID